MIDKQRLISTAKEYKIQLEDPIANKLDKYAEMIIEWNSKINLTAITEPEQMINKHFIDSLLFASQPELTGKLVDVGSGAGFPGIVAKIYKPQLDTTLIEPTGKKVAFLQAVGEELNLKLYYPVKERAEEAARKKWRETFDVASARAVAALPTLCEYCLPLVKVGGYFIAMKANAQQEVQDAQFAITKLGGQYIETREFTLPDGAARSLVIIKKVEPTNEVYPRSGGTIKKKPLCK